MVLTDKFEFITPILENISLGLRVPHHFKQYLLIHAVRSTLNLVSIFEAIETFSMRSLFRIFLKTKCSTLINTETYFL